MKIILAPMDGITDFYVRQILTSVGGYDLSMTEFLRVTNSVFPKRVFYQNCPEINPEINSNLELLSFTQSGTPVHMQLLGSDADYLAANAAKAVELGVKGIDVNFGCPAKTVNGHGGGAVLLQDPEILYKLVSTIRKDLPSETPLSAKMRLGYETSDLLLDNAKAIEEAGADFITIHARTKFDGYRPPAKWHEVTDLFAKINIPIVLNGEIWDVNDYLKCQQISSCQDIMLGRGAFARPDLAKQIKTYLNHQPYQTMSWDSICVLLKDFYQFMVMQNLISEKYIAGRLKLWIKWLMASYDEAVFLFEQIKRISDAKEIGVKLQCHG
ncbi:MAG: tRNA-dihydrouridine synthase [Gammaproteobacteria bacterium]|nr:tRNA-dihydrouridine synthase [Gammaproteobacteria bacterium]